MSNFHVGKFVFKRLMMHKEAKSDEFLDVGETFWRVCPRPAAYETDFLDRRQWDHPSSRAPSLQKSCVRAWF